LTGRRGTGDQQAIVTHIKPRYRQEVMADLRALNLPQVEVVCPGSTYEF
jgi:hypothetical protein